MRIVAQRIVTLALVIVTAAAAGMALREWRQARTDQSAGESVMESSSGVAAAPRATPVAKWSTLRIDIPSELAVWSMHISPDGSEIAGLRAQPPGAGMCTAVDKVSPPSCNPGLPPRVLRYTLRVLPGTTTVSLTRIAETLAIGGFHWLPDGGLVTANLDAPAPGSKAYGKTVSVEILENDGRKISLGSVDGGSVPAPALSADGRWLAFAQWSGAVLIVERRTGARKQVALDVAGMPTPLAWSADGRVFTGQDATLFRVALDGAVDRIPAPAGARLYGALSTSPDGSILLFRAMRSKTEEVVAYAKGQWVDVPLDALRASWSPIWMNAHELLLRTTANALRTFDVLTGTTRDLGFTMSSNDPRILAYSDRHLVWREGDAGPIHVLDLLAARDVIIATTPDRLVIQPYGRGSFLLLYQDGAELLTAGR